jgi:hypothetical protein
MYKNNMHQVTIHVTITDSTPQAVAAIINDAGDGHPAHTTPDPGGHAYFSDLAQAPIGPWAKQPQTRALGGCVRAAGWPRAGWLSPDGACSAAGQPAAAQAELAAAAGLAAGAGNTCEQASAHCHLAESHHRAGQHEQARHLAAGPRHAHPARNVQGGSDTQPARRAPVLLTPAAWHQG